MLEQLSRRSLQEIKMQIARQGDNRSLQAVGGCKHLGCRPPPYTMYGVADAVGVGIPAGRGPNRSLLGGRHVGGGWNRRRLRQRSSPGSFHQVS